jgi:hypothetical protein
MKLNLKKMDTFKKMGNYQGNFFDCVFILNIFVKLYDNLIARQEKNAVQHFPFQAGSNMV